MLKQKDAEELKGEAPDEKNPGLSAIQTLKPKIGICTDRITVELIWKICCIYRDVCGSQQPDLREIVASSTDAANIAPQLRELFYEITDNTDGPACQRRWGSTLVGSSSKLYAMGDKVVPEDLDPDDESISDDEFNSRMTK